MSAQVLLTLSDTVYNRAQHVAELTGWTLEEAVETMLELSLPAVYPQIDFDQPVSALLDRDVLVLADMQMADAYDAHYSDLLDLQQAGELSEDERKELRSYQRVYEIGMIYKSEALAEATRRGLASSEMKG